MLDKIADEYQDKLELVKVNADLPENEELLREYDIRSIPTLILMLDGKVMSKSVGAKPEQQLRAWINVHVALEDAISSE